MGNTSSGIIKSPNFGKKYSTGLNRLYIIRASPGKRILLEPVVLKVEGQMKADGKYGTYFSMLIKTIYLVHVNFVL